jgi:outer membrane lipoprotein-sorting protein
MRLIALIVLLFCSSPAWCQALVNPTGDDHRDIVLTPASDLDTILDALNARGQNLKDFSCDVALHTVDNRTGQDTSQIGNVTFQNRKDGDSRIRVSFETRITDVGNGHPMTQKQKLDYVLDKGWLTDRDYQKKLEVKRQVLKPDQKMNLLKLGEGPFPLPIGQDKADVKKQFSVTKAESAKDDPKDTVHVTLIPKAGSQLEKRFKQIDVFVDLKNNMPARIDTVEKAGTTRSTELTNVKLNAGIADDAFILPDIDKAGWNRREEPFQ